MSSDYVWKPDRAFNDIGQHIPEPNTIYWKAGQLARCSPYARKEDAAKRLWKLSERLCGIEDYFYTD